MTLSSVVQTAAFVGIDLGGTGIRLVCLVDGQAVGDVSFLTSELDEMTPGERIHRLAHKVRAIVPAVRSLARVGIGATGPVDVGTGVIDNRATLPQLSGFDLPGQLAAVLGVPVCIDNDSVAAAIGEWSRYDGHPPGRLLMITLGTGVGGCLLVDGGPLRTSIGTHPEIGHLPVHDDGPACYCGLRGCWEPQASRTALQDGLSRLVESTVPRDGVLTAAALRISDDAAVRDCFLDYGRKVGRGLAVLQVVYGPSVIVLGGGAASLFDHFEAGIRQEFTQDPAYCPPSLVVPSQLGERAGAFGAAVMAQRSAAGSTG